MRSSYLLHNLPLPGFTVADFTDPTKKWLRNLPLPNFPVAQFSVVFSLPSFPLPTLPLPSLPQIPHTPLYKERSRNNYTLHTPSGYPDGVAQHYTSPFPGVALALALACEGSMYHIKGESTLRMMDTFFTFEIFRYPFKKDVKHIKL